MKKILLLLLIFTASASADTNGTKYKLRSNLKSSLNISGSKVMQDDLNMGGHDIDNIASINVDTITTDDLTVSDLIATRLVFAGIGGLLSDDADLTFITNTLFATNLTSSGTGTFGQIIDNGLTASLGVYTDGSKQLTSTPPTSGDLGFWNRTGTVLTPATSGDGLSVTGDTDLEGLLQLNADAGSAGDIITSNGALDPTWKTPTVDIPIVLTSYEAAPAKSSESNIHGALQPLGTGGTLNSGSPLALATKGIGKLVLVVNDGGGDDMVGTITATGTSVHRDTGVTTGSDTAVMTLAGVTTDGADTDGNGNGRHALTRAYITDKWFVGVVTLTTTDVTLTDLDSYHVSFEQFNDAPDLTLDTFDANLKATNANGNFDAYLYCVEVTGDQCDITRCADLNLGVPTPGNYYRTRKGALARSLNGTTDGVFVDVFYSNSPTYIEDVTIKVWATQSQSLTLN